jgi:hypothetical protein
MTGTVGVTSNGGNPATLFARSDALGAAIVTPTARANITNVIRTTAIHLKGLISYLLISFAESAQWSHAGKSVYIVVTNKEKSRVPLYRLKHSVV